MTPRVAVIGAGPLGLVALKNLKEDGFDVTGYEARPYVGGLWKYSEDSALSVAESTIFNSSRYRSAFSDFPFPADTDDFPTWQQMHQYLESYCDHFDLRRHIHLSSPVTGLSREENQWVLEVSTQGSPLRHEYFDKVLVATGSFVIPITPQVPGIEKFEGPALHAINFKQPSKYQDKNILLIGLHATAQDISVALSRHASKLYISHRNGVILFPRYTSDGAVFDYSQNLAVVFFQLFMSTWFPNVSNWLFDKIIRAMSAKAYPNIPKSWNLSPAPSVSVTPPLIADEIFPLLESGFAEPVSSVKCIAGPKKVELTNGRVLSDIDAIVYCTGYDIAVPFMPSEFNPYHTVGEVPNLYRGIFPLHPDPLVRNSLAYLGHAATAFPGFVQHELIAMAISQTWLGNSHLPSFEDMKEWHRNWLAWRKDLISKQKLESTFYVVFQPFADHFHWLDKTAGTGVIDHFGWFSTKAWSFWWREKALYKKCRSGILSPAIWRLFETGKRKAWTRAREQIWQDNENIARQIRERNKKMEQTGDKKTS